MELRNCGHSLGRLGDTVFPSLTPSDSDCPHLIRATQTLSLARQLCAHVHMTTQTPNSLSPSTCQQWVAMDYWRNAPLHMVSHGPADLVLPFLFFTAH